MAYLTFSINVGLKVKPLRLPDNCPLQLQANAPVKTKLSREEFEKAKKTIKTRPVHISRQRRATK